MIQSQLRMGHLYTVLMIHWNIEGGGGELGLKSVFNLSKSYH